MTPDADVTETDALDREAAALEAAAALVAEAKPILLRDFNGEVCLEGEWPAVARIASVLLTQADLAKVDGNALTFTLGNARAVYELAYETDDGKTLIYRLIEGAYAAAPVAPAADEPLLVASTQIGGATSTQLATDLDAKAAEILESLEDPADPAPDEPASKPRTQGLVTEPADGSDPNVKCPECRMYGNRHKRGCSRAA
jgi:hypothetical protein